MSDVGEETPPCMARPDDLEVDGEDDVRGIGVGCSEFEPEKNPSLLPGTMGFTGCKGGNL